MTTLEFTRHVQSSNLNPSLYNPVIQVHLKTQFRTIYRYDALLGQISK